MSAKPSAYPPLTYLDSITNPTLIALLAIAGIATFITWVIVGSHLVRHWRQGQRERKMTILFPPMRRRVMAQCLWPAIKGLFNFLSLLFPKCVLFFMFLSSSYEGVMIASFVELIAGFSGGKMITARLLMSRHEKSKHYGALPFGCYCRPCMKKSNLQPREYQFIRLGIIQTAFARPVLATLGLFLQLNGWYDQSLTSLAFLILTIFEVFSIMIAVYCIGVLSIASKGIKHVHLGTFNIFNKYVLVRLMIIPFVLQELIIAIAFRFIHTDVLFPDYLAFSARGWEMVLICIEMIPMTAYFVWTYKVDELNTSIEQWTASYVEANKSLLDNGDGVKVVGGLELQEANGDKGVQAEA